MQATRKVLGLILFLTIACLTILQAQQKICFSSSVISSQEDQVEPDLQLNGWPEQKQHDSGLNCSNLKIGEMLKSERLANQKAFHAQLVGALSLSSRNTHCDKQLNPRSAARYENLATAFKSDSFFIAVNMFNNQEVAPDFFFQLNMLIMYLGRSNVFISIFENGSHDQTKTFLGIFKVLLDNLGVSHEIKMSREGQPSGQHRIENLAKVRNTALEPLQKLEARGKFFAKIIFLNDIIYCATDIQELLFQSYLQQADITCGLDFIRGGDNQLVFYDTWVARDIAGRIMVNRQVI